MEKFNLIEYGTVSSTNDIVRGAIEQGEGEGFIAAAKSQDGGKGRRGNLWASPEGGLYMSLLLEPPRSSNELPTLGMTAALSVCEVLNGYLPSASGLGFRIKWPNDVVAVNTSEGHGKAFRKICGISTDLIHGKACLGIGINVFRPTESYIPASQRNIPVYLEDLAEFPEVLSIDRLREQLLARFSESYSVWKKSGFADFAEAVNSYSALAGKQVEIRSEANAVASGLTYDPSSGEFVAGTVEGILENGALSVREAASGEMLEIHEGSVSLASAV